MNKVIIIFAVFCVAVAVARRPQAWSAPSQQAWSAPSPQQSGGGGGDERPDPYQFTYQSVGEDRGQQSRQETADGSGAIKGQYTIQNPDGTRRTVTYTADDQNGFQAQVQSNEPGVISSNPAGAVYSAQ